MCRLCKENKPLKKSHIFPEWLYKPLYNDRHQFYVLSTDENKRRSTRPKGIYEKLLCHDCEQRFSKWEGYAREIFYDHDLPLKVEDTGKRFILSGLQYTPFKLFQISLIWRASITSRPEIHRINLGPHAERIRKMLLEDCPGDSYEYGSILMLPSLDQEMMQQFLYSPERLPTKLDGHTAYRAAFGGLFWLFIVSSHSGHLPQDMFLSKEGRLPVHKVGMPIVKFMQKLAANFSAACMLNDPV